MFPTLFVFVFFFATLPYFGGSEEQVGLWPFRDERFFIGLIIDTYWCGSSGNVSRGFYELGPNYLVDACCRSHELCDVYIEPGETNNGVKNDGHFTISSCDCNFAFYHCLTTVNSYSSSMVISAYGSTYPECLIRRPMLRCRSPDNDFNRNPYKGYRNSENAADDKNLCLTSESRCEIYDVTDQFEYAIVDSLFKIHQLQLDQQSQKTTTRPNDMAQNTMVHRSHAPQPPPSSSMFVPTVLQLFRGLP